MQTNYAINLLNWRLQVVRKQAVYFGGLLLATLLLTASVVSILFGYQQQLKNNFVQQNQQQTALRQANQQLQQQINQLQQQNSFALQQPHFATTYLATTNIAEQNIFVLFIDFLSHLPLQQGRLISAAIAQPSADADYNIRLEGITPSHQEFEQLRDSFDSCRFSARRRCIWDRSTSGLGCQSATPRPTRQSPSQPHLCNRSGAGPQLEGPTSSGNHRLAVAAVNSGRKHGRRRAFVSANRPDAGKTSR